MLKLAAPMLLLALALAGVLAADRPRPRADLTLLNRGDVTTLDLQRMSWMQDLRVAGALFEGLVTHDVFSWDYTITPAVAESWEVSEDGRTYTFRLRSTARWSNGAPVTAGDFVYSWRRGLMPELAGDYIGLFQLIEGGKAFYEWRQERLTAFAREGGGAFRPGEADALWRETLARLDGVGLAAPDDRTFVVRLERPTPYFLDVCAMEVFMPVYGPLVDRYQSVDATTGRLAIRSGWTKPPELVCNGPFVVREWRFKREMRLERNPMYWDPGRVSIDSIGIPSQEEPSASVLAFHTGAVDWLTDVTVDYAGELVDRKRAFYGEHREAYERMVAEGLDPIEIDRRLPDDPRAHLHVLPAFGTYFFNFNCQARLADGRDNPFADRRVRRAFAMAIDKRALAEEIRRTGEPPASTLIPPGTLAGYPSPAGLPYDPAGARALLAEAGYADPAAFPMVEILINRDGGHDRNAQAVAKDWQNALGVRVVIAQKETKVFREDLKTGNFMVSRAGWYADYGDPTTFLDLSRTGDGNNDRRFSSPAYDALLDEAANERDASRRLRILGEAERMLVEDELPMVPLYHYASIYMFNAHRLSGVSSHPRLKQKLPLMDILGDGKGAERPRAMPARPPRAGAPKPAAAGRAPGLTTGASPPLRAGDRAGAAGRALPCSP